MSWSKTETLLTYILGKTTGEADFSGDSSALVFSCSRWARKRAGAALIALTQNERGETLFPPVLLNKILWKGSLWPVSRAHCCEWRRREPCGAFPSCEGSVGHGAGERGRIPTWKKGTVQTEPHHMCREGLPSWELPVFGLMQDRSTEKNVQHQRYLLLVSFLLLKIVRWGLKLWAEVPRLLNLVLFKFLNTPEEWTHDWGWGWQKKTVKYGVT